MDEVFVLCDNLFSKLKEFDDVQKRYQRVAVSDTLATNVGGAAGQSGTCPPTNHLVQQLHIACLGSPLRIFPSV
jgi:hypothetical protein